MCSVDQIKRATLLAARLHEENYNRNQHRYELHTDEAAMLACRLLGVDEEFARLIGLALSGWWNDTCDWANTRKRDRRYRRKTVKRRSVHSAELSELYGEED